MEHDWSMGLDADSPASSGHHHSNEEWVQVMARTIAHLAAQLTMSQLRLRALASELGAGGAIDERAVQGRLDHLAETETASYLRENLGDALAEVVDIDELARDIASFLHS